MIVSEPIANPSQPKNRTRTVLAPMQIGPGQQVSMPVLASDDAFRDVMRNIALVALSSDAGLALDDDAQNELMGAAGNALLGVQERLSGQRANLGFARARIDDSAARNEAAKSSLELARTKLISADPFDTAIRLQETQSQLENLFAVTARTAQLSLTRFL